MTRTVVAIYDDLAVARRVTDELAQNGIKGNDISLVAGLDAGMHTGISDEAAQQAHGKTGMGDLDALTLPGIGRIAASGWLADALAGSTVVSLGSALRDAGLPVNHAGLIEEYVRDGSALVTLRTEDGELAGRAAQIMDRYNPVDLDLRSPGSEAQLSDPKRRSPVDTDLARAESESFTRADFTLPGQERADEGAFMGGAIESSAGRRGVTGEPEPDADLSTSAYTGRESQQQSPSVRAGERALLDFDVYEPEFRQHYETTLTNAELPYDYYRPAYRYGYDLATSERFQANDWQEIETEAHRAWDETNPANPWADYREAVLEGWKAVRQTASR